MDPVKKIPSHSSKFNAFITGFIDSTIPKTINRNARLFLAAGFLNGVSNGIFNSVMMLYLTTFGFGGQDLGTIFMMNALSSTILTIPIGVLADRYGKKKIVTVGLISVIISLTIFFIANSWELFALSFVFIGVCNSTGTIFSPLYSMFFEKDSLDQAFGLWQVINIGAMSLGSLTGFLPTFMMSYFGLSKFYAYRYLLMFAGILFILPYVLWLLSCQGIKENYVKKFEFNLKSKTFILKMCVLGFLSNLSGGLLFGLFPYYVNQKFGIESDGLGALFFASNLAMALTKGTAAAVAKSIGRMKSIAFGIAASAIFFILIPISPSFGVLSIFYILRMGTRFMSDPLISSLFMRTVGEDEKSTANSLRMISLNGSSVIAPWLGGTMMEKIGLDSPAYTGAIMTFLLSFLIPIFLRKEIHDIAESEKLGDLKMDNDNTVIIEEARTSK